MDECRGALLDKDDLSLLGNYPELCEHLKKNWKLYTDKADEIRDRLLDQNFEEGKDENLIPYVKTGIQNEDWQTHLSRQSEALGVSYNKAAIAFAKACFVARKVCSPSVSQVVDECKGG